MMASYTERPKHISTLYTTEQELTIKTTNGTITPYAASETTDGTI